MSGITPLYLPSSLPFPIFVSRLCVKGEGTSIRRTDKLLIYEYLLSTSSRDDEKDPNKKGKPREESVMGVFESPMDGELVNWDIAEGDSILNSKTRVATIKEPCAHLVQWGGLCTMCGKDLTNKDYIDYSDLSRAPISMAHEHKELTVSHAQASQYQSEHNKHLLESQKLTLIVDLDLTIVHATVDSIVGNWMKDESNPNYEALQDIGSFYLAEENRWIEPSRYFVKMRPGLKQFLDKLSEKFEMHVYTMGTREYATAVCKLIDPKGELFGSRVLSRSESGGLNQKRLERLFPVDTSMVAVIDDRSDVWDDKLNLIKVIPFEFFPGGGDINSAFLKDDKPIVPPDSSSESKNAQDSENSSSSPSQTEQEKHKVPLVNSHDYELERLLKILNELHDKFFDAVKNNINKAPDVTDILPSMKKKVLQGCHILFSSVIPIGVDPTKMEIWRLAMEFGAVIESSLNDRVTHLVARKAGTEKIHNARKNFPNVKIVYLEWLIRSIELWDRQDEQIFEVPYDADDNSITAEETRPNTRSTTPTEKPPPDLAVVKEHNLEDDLKALDEETDSEDDNEDIDWDEIDKEVDEALLESDDDAAGSDAERNKRPHSVVSGDESEGGDQHEDYVSPLLKRQRVARSRKSRLNVSFGSVDEKDVNKNNNDSNINNDNNGNNNSSNNNSSTNDSSKQGTPFTESGSSSSGSSSSSSSSSDEDQEAKPAV